MLVAIRTNYRTFRATVTAITNIFYTVTADITVITPTSIANTIYTFTTVGAKVTGAISTLFSTFRTDISTFGATIATRTYVIGTVNAGFTAIAEITFATDAVSTYATASANAFWLTINTFFVTFGTYACALVTALATNTNYYTIATHVAVRTPSVITDATNTITASGTYFTGTVFALLGTTRTNRSTGVAALTAIANYCAITTGATITTPSAICS